mgnify:CR=1 FL=1
MSPLPIVPNREELKRLASCDRLPSNMKSVFTPIGLSKTSRLHKPKQSIGKWVVSASVACLPPSAAGGKTSASSLACKIDKRSGIDYTKTMLIPLTNEATSTTSLKYPGLSRHIYPLDRVSRQEVENDRKGNRSLTKCQARRGSPCLNHVRCRARRRRASSGSTRGLCATGGVRRAIVTQQRKAIHDRRTAGVRYDPTALIPKTRIVTDGNILPQWHSLGLQFPSSHPGAAMT